MVAVRTAFWFLVGLALCCQGVAGEAGNAVTLAFLPTEYRCAQVREADSLAVQIDSVCAVATSSEELPDRLAPLERAALDEILREQTVRGAGIRPVLASTLLVSSSLVDLPDRRVLLQMEAIAGDNGRLIHSLHITGDIGDPEGMVRNLERRLPVFLDELLQEFEDSQRLPLVELTSELKSNWLGLLEQRDDVQNALSSILSTRSDCVQLIARHPLTLAEERLLKTMGISEPADVEGYRPAADIRIRVTLDPDLSGKPDLHAVPLALYVSLARSQTVLAETTIRCTPADWREGRDRAVAWVQAQLPIHLATGGATRNEDPETDARERARQNQAFIVDVLGGELSRAVSIRSDQVRETVLSHALRAYQSDPTQAVAGYLVALLDGADEPLATQSPAHRLQQYDLIVRRCRRSMERFPRRKPNTLLYDHVLFRMSDYAKKAQNTVGLVAGERGRDPWLDAWSDESRYRYRSIYLRALAEMGYNDRDGTCSISWNGAISFGYSVVEMILVNCPEPRLGEEYQYWREFYGTEMSRLDQGGKLADVYPAPWLLLEAAFAARHRDVPRVKRCFDEMAKRHPVSENWLWLDGKRVREMLLAAGAQDAETWQPELRKSHRRTFSRGEWQDFLCGLRPPFPEHYGQKKLLPMRKWEVLIPSRSDGDRLQVEYVSGNDVFLSLAEWPSVSEDARDSAIIPPLYVAQLDCDSQRDGPARLKDVSPLLPGFPLVSTGGKPRPVIVTCATSQPTEDGMVVWLGTVGHGVIMCTKGKGGQWAARSLGLETIPAMHIVSMVACRMRGAPGMLVSGYLDERQRQVLFAIEATGTQCRMLGSAEGGPIPRLFCWVAGMDIRLVPCPASGSPPFGPMDIDHVQRFTGRGLDLYHAVTSFDPVTEQGAIWGLECVNLPLRHTSLREVVAGTDRLTERTAFPTPRAISMLYHRGPYPDLRTTGVFSYGPTLDVRQVVSGMPVIWMLCGVYSPAETANSGARLVGFRPGLLDGPKGEDEWIGPFVTSKGAIDATLRVVGGNRLLVRDLETCYLIEPDELCQAAEAAGQVKTARQIRVEVEEQLQQAGWRALVPAHIAMGEYAKAMDAIRAALASAAASDAGQLQYIELWRARLLAQQARDKRQGWDDGIDAYAKIAGDPQNNDFVRALAFVLQLRLLEEARRYEDFLAAYDSPPECMPCVTYRGYSMRGMLTHGLIEQIRAKAAQAANVGTGPLPPFR